MKSWFVLKAGLMLTTAVFTLSGCASNGIKQTEIERITPEQLAKIMPPPVATITLDDIVNDSKAGKSADEIIVKIKASNSRYALTPTQTLDLNKQGVDTKVLDYIQQSNELAKQNAIADEMNKRARERAAAEKILKRERDLARDRYYDPFFDSRFGPRFGPRFGGFYGNPYYGYGSRFGHRFGFGLGYGYPYGW